MIQKCIKCGKDVLKITDQDRWICTRCLRDELPALSTEMLEEMQREVREVLALRLDRRNV